MLGLPFVAVPAAVDEAPEPGELPAAYAERLARRKAMDVARLYPEALVIGSDTVVVVDGRILGKPEDREEAVEMLLLLQGRQHQVHTGVAVAEPGGKVISTLESALVRFRSFDALVAGRYADTGEPLDKAGGYGVQGYGATLVERIEGDFYAVMGLPLVATLSLLERVGWRYDYRGLRPCEH